MRPLPLNILPFRYWAISWAVVLLLLLAQAGSAHLSGPLTVGFFVVAALTYAALYLLPLLLVPPLGRVLTPVLGAPAARALSGALLVLWSGTVQLGLMVDLLVYRMYGFHLNGFVWNLVSTPGGLDSLGAGASAWAMAVAATVAVLAGNTSLLRLTRRHSPSTPGDVRRLWAMVAALLLCAVGERLVYGVSHFTGRSSLVNAAFAIPFY